MEELTIFKDVVIGVSAAIATILSDRQLVKWRLKGLERRMDHVEEVVFPPLKR